MADDFDPFVERALAEGAAEAVLRPLFGDALYRELSELARTEPPNPALLEGGTGRTVLILPGIMGSKLALERNGRRDAVWIDPFDLIAGGIRKLRMDQPGRILPTGVVLFAYLKMKMRLRRAGFRARFAPYDWRRDPAQAGAALIAAIRRQRLSNVALVAHSMGGLVARQAAALDPDAHLIGDVVTVGTPNRGSYSPVEVFRLTHGLIAKLDALDLRHDAREIVSDVVRHFPSLVQMMPDRTARPDEDWFTEAGWPRGGAVPVCATLDAARRAAAALPPPDERFRQIVGIGQNTILSARGDGDRIVYTRGTDGDGTVPRDLAEMDMRTGPVPRYYVAGVHGGLMNRNDVIAAVTELLSDGTTTALPAHVPVLRESGAPVASAPDWTTPPHDLPAGGVLTPRDLLRGFLEGLPEDQADDAALHEAAQVPPETPVEGYNPADVAAAADRWDRLEAWRETVARNVAQGNPIAAETPERVDLYVDGLMRQVDDLLPEREAAMPDILRRAVVDFVDRPEEAAADIARSPLPLERVIGAAEEFLSVSFVKRAGVAIRSVGRILIQGDHLASGTGFLVAPGILMTNHHVLPTAAAAKRASVEFDYELDATRRAMVSQVFDLEPDRFFVANAELDYALITVAPHSQDGAAIEPFGYLPLIEGEGKARIGGPVNIVQHPRGERKQIVFRNSTLIALPADIPTIADADHVAVYTGDTRRGSSGSPVFNDRWEVVALHHAAVPDRDARNRYVTRFDTPWDRAADPHMSTIRWVANEGIRVSRLVAHIRATSKRKKAAGSQARACFAAVLAGRPPRGDVHTP